MADHDLLHDLAAREREALQSRPPEWDAYARAEIDADQVAQRLRARGISESSIARGLELFAPPPAAFDEDLVAKLIGSEPAAATNVVARPDAGWWRRRGAALIGAAAVAAAIAVFAWPSAPPGVDGGGTSLVQLPAHEMSIQAAATVRGSADEVVRVAPGAELTLLLRPARSYTVRPSVGVCMRRGDDVRVLAATADVGEPGQAFEVHVALPDEVADGAAEIVAVLAGGPLPADLAASCASGGAGVQLVRKPIAVAR